MGCAAMYVKRILSNNPRSKQVGLQRKPVGLYTNRTKDTTRIISHILKFCLKEATETHNIIWQGISKVKKSKF